MPKGLFSMGTMGWTPAAQLATQNLAAAGQTNAAMDKRINQTTTTKQNGGSVFGDLLPIIGAGVGAALGGAGVGGMTALEGMGMGSGIGGMLGSAAGGQSAASIGGMGLGLSKSLGSVAGGSGGSGSGGTGSTIEGGASNEYWKNHNSELRAQGRH